MKPRSFAAASTDLQIAEQRQVKRQLASVKRPVSCESRTIGARQSFIMGKTVARPVPAGTPQILRSEIRATLCNLKT